MHKSFALGPFCQLLTMRHLPLKGPLRDEQLEVIEQGGVIIRDGKIAAIGPFERIRRVAKEDGLGIKAIEKPMVALPGFIDAHTHLCFAGSRAKDYALRAEGKTYLEIAKAGGGIWDTVMKTRAAAPAELEALSVQRAQRHFLGGVTTIEVKSGYTLTIEGELKMLRAIQATQTQVKADLIPTCLPAHIVPKDFIGDEIAYIQHMLTHFFPIVQAEGLAQRADIFVEEGAFSVKAATLYMQALQQQGFDLTVHADQFSLGGSALAVRHKARSADHLEASGEAEIKALAASEVIPVALPGASIGLGCEFAPGRRLLDAGASLAIASDWNPGSAPMGDLLTVASIYGMFEKLSTAEVLAGIGFRAAAALGLSDRGRLIEGQIADIVAFPVDDYREILYQQGQLRPGGVWKRGR
ncbi:MAG: imidazolonepropionase [Saprospiraceae bacterium]